MTIENSPTEPTEPVAAAPKGGTAKPNNQYQDIIATDVTAETAATTTTTKPGGAQPDNQYQDSAPKG